MTILTNVARDWINGREYVAVGDSFFDVTELSARHAYAVGNAVRKHEGLAARVNEAKADLDRSWATAVSGSRKGYRIDDWAGYRATALADALKEFSASTSALVEMMFLLAGRPIPADAFRWETIFRVGEDVAA